MVILLGESNQTFGKLPENTDERVPFLATIFICIGKTHRNKRLSFPLD
ncbi:MAG: hypothetical protein JWR38_367 [Mucilaginibacter sp.]|nr:hypothetical protein [Mucilaginibacter sp.]